MRTAKVSKGLYSRPVSGASSGLADSFIDRFVNPIVWRIPGHDAWKLHSFALAEQSSSLDLLAAARLTPSVERRALYLRHALDEARHALIYSHRSAELRRLRGRNSYGRLHADTEDLFERLGEVGFLAFVHRGEWRGRRRFDGHRDFFARCGDQRMRAMFEGVLQDERRHESYTHQLLVELAGGEHQARAELRRSATWEAWRSWRRAGRFLAMNLYILLMTVFYVALAPLALAVRIVRPEPRGWSG